MQNFNRGLATDKDVSQGPENTMSFAKNGVMENGTPTSEKGFTQTDNTTYPIIGKVDAVDRSVIISGNGVNTEIGILKNGVYTTVVDDATLPFRIGLKPENFVTGRSQRNYNDELVVVITNKDIPPLYINCDNFVAPLDIGDLYLQPRADVPVLTIDEEPGGSLNAGAYFALIALSKKDGTTTHWLTIAGPIIIGGTGIENKSLKIVATGVDSSYSLAQVAIVHKDTNSQLNAYGLEDIQVVDGSIRVSYTGTNFPIGYAVSEVLSLPLFYDRVNSIGQLNDSLYLAGTEILEPPILQQWASRISVSWRSVPASPGTKTFPHEEVLALYVRYIRKSGARTKAYIIPGLEPTATELTADAVAVANGMTGENSLNYRTNPTPRTFNSTLKTGAMCAWRNENEVYPDNEYFDATSIGGLNRRGQPVCHHRLPSIRWCKANLYAADSNYGRTYLDQLQLVVTNVAIPPGTDIVGYELLYAQRGPANALVQGQSVMHCNAYLSGAPGANIMSTGGNWDSRLSVSGGPEYPLVLDKKNIRMIPFDVRFNNINVQGSIISAQLNLRHNDMDGTAIAEDGAVGGPTNAPYVWLFDYITSPHAVVSLAPDSQRLRRVVRMESLINNTLKSPWNNLHLESAIVAEVNADYTILASGVNPNSTADSLEGACSSAQEEYLASIIQFKPDLYQSFANQTLVFAARGTLNVDLITGNGDAYISDYTQHAYGKIDARDRDQGNEGLANRGVRVIRRYLCETVSNLAFRYELDNNPYSRYYPKSSINNNNDGANNYFLQQFRTSDPNQFGYSTAFNTLANLIQSPVFSVDTNPITKFPFRIHRTGKLSRQNKYKSWRTLLPLDYYEMPRTFGPVVRVEGYKDKLLINMQRAFYVTIGNVSLQTDSLSITLGSGDIFRVEPEEMLPDSSGVGGLQDELAAVLTPMGYVWFDAEAAEVYLYSDKLRSITNLMSSFFSSLEKLRYHNPFRSEGVHLGYDPDKKRLLLTYKKTLPNNLPELTDTTVPAVDELFVYKGHVVKYIGTTTGCGEEVGCSAPTITATTPNVDGIDFEDALIPVLGFSVTKDAQVLLSINPEYSAEKTGTVGLLDTYILYFRPSSNTDYTSSVTITVLNECGSAQLVHSVDVNAVGGGGGGGGLGQFMNATYSTVEAGICSLDPQGVWIGLFEPGIQEGVSVYLDQYLTTPLTGQSFIKGPDGLIWELDTNGLITGPAMDGLGQKTC